MMWGKAKAGMRHNFYDTGIIVRCVNLDKNEVGKWAAPDTENVFCSKTGRITEFAQVGKDKSKAARLWFRPVTSKYHSGYNKRKDTVVARCNLRKHTACRGGHCKVQKFVFCHSICIMDGWCHWNSNLSVPKYKHCSKKYCKGFKGKMGALACKNVARMA